VYCGKTTVASPVRCCIWMRTLAVSNLCIRCIGATLYVTMVTVTNTFSKWNLQFFLYTLGKRIVFFLLPEAFCMWPKICRKCDSGRGSAPDPAGGAHDVPPDSLVGWGADTPPHAPPYSAPRCSRLRRLDRRAPLTLNPGDATGHHHFSGKVALVIR